MDNNQDKIWSEVKSQVQNYEPDEYTAADWDEMETVLEAAAKPPGLINGAFYPKLLLLLVIGTSLALFSRTQLGKPLETNQHHAESQTNTAIDIVNSAQDAPKTSVIELDEQKPVQEGTLVGSDEKDHSNRNKELVAADLAKDRTLQMETSLSTKQVNTATQETKITNPKEGAPIEKVGVKNISTSFEMEPLRQELQVVEEPKMEDAFNNSPASLIPTLETTVVWKAENDQMDLPRSGRKISSKWRLGVTFGANTTVTDYERKTMSALPFIGIFARKPLNAKWELQLETQFKPVANYNVTQHYEEEVYSSVGYLGTAVQEWTYEAYVSVEFPVVLKYAASKRTGLLFGARYSFISPHGSSSSSSGNYYYYNEPLFNRTPRKGFWESDIGLIVGAEHYLGGRWLLSIRYAQGLRDITPDNLYNNTKTHLNSDLQIAVHHYF